MSLSLRAHIATLPAYRPGQPAQPGPDGRSWKLSSNENPYPPLPGVVEAIAASLSDINRYPDAGNADITAALATRHGIAEDSMAFGNGSVEVLAHLLLATCQAGDEVVYPWRSFEAYPGAIQRTGATGVAVPLQADGSHDLEAMLAAITPATRAVALCTPNNPTGSALSHTDVASFLSQVRDDILVILDEAYVEFVTDPEAAQGLELLDLHPGLVSLRTFSKAYGLAGMRVGWMAAADPALAQAVRSATMPFAISIPAQAAVLACLGAEPELINRVRTIVAERERIVPAVRDLGFQVPPTQANFFWLPAAEASAAMFDACRDAGLAVRAFAGEGVRISIGEPEANDRVLDVLADLRR